MNNEEPLFVVLNGGSGNIAAQTRQDEIAEVLREAGRRFEILVAEDPRELPAIAKRAVELAERDGGIVVAAGGDGTINTVAQAVLKSGRPFGVLPQGTFNFTGRAHAIPTDTKEATRALLTATVRPVQIGLVNDRVFLVNASLGLYPRLLEDRELYKHRFGRSRVVAILAGLVTLFRQYRNLRLSVRVEGVAGSIETPSLVVGNNLLQLQNIGIAEAEVVQHGQLAAITVRPIGSLAMVWLAFRGMLGRMGAAENVDTFPFARMNVHMKGRKVKVAIDGELIWLAPPLVFGVSPRPLLMLVPEVDPVASEAAEAGAQG